MTCSFCGKGQEDWNFLIEGTGVSICDVCVANCMLVIEQLAMNLIYQHEMGIVDGDWGDG